MECNVHCNFILLIFRLSPLKDDSKLSYIFILFTLHDLVAFATLTDRYSLNSHEIEFKPSVKNHRHCMPFEKL